MRDSMRANGTRASASVRSRVSRSPWTTFRVAFRRRSTQARVVS